MTEAVEFITNQGGIAALVILALVAGARGQWVFGREHKAMTEDRDYWRSLAEGALDISANAVGLAERRKR